MDNIPTTETKRLFTGRKQLKQDIEHVTQEMYKRNFELAEANKTLSLLRAIDSIVLESHDELGILCQNIASAIAKYTSYPLVAILVNPPHKDYLEMLGLAGASGIEDMFKSCKVKEDDHETWLVSPEQKAILDISSVDSRLIAEVLCLSEDQVNDLKNESGIKTILLLKLLSRHRLVGVLAIGLNQEKIEVHDKQEQLIERLSETVGIALDSKLLFEENQQVLRQLQKTNEKLKTLDETKDEFISMASHQLRTPLTSVKGYLSMVLEGDAGEIGEMQRKLLDQAFVSSQRMVYLIADLLNVSRLRTGKFVLEAVPSNLAEVVEGEIGQLKETAAGRGLKLTYDKPADFPELYLDETKIRQVIMNFTDNAIYYTPSGGHIVVKLEDKGESIEFTVTDDGMGVPKVQQPNLFTKFYRADNARKARPDGTGLGLFMAKKVIVVQGGNLLFTSQEGKGSTFGFAFPKSKLQPPPTPEPTATSS
ncbi:hypothetical protein H0X10_00665 [Candidatus Saccharibacteria bacterium]|nr:hypothetical protein [Candidatus Saccharibacteria bacterium]